MITFSDNIERKPYLGSTEIAEVWLGNIKIYPDNVEPPTPSGYENQYLTFEALEDNTFTFSPKNDNVVKYSLNNGRTWVEGNIIQVSKDNKVLVKGELIPTTTLLGVGGFSSSGSFNIYGNIMSLLYSDNFKGKTDLTGYNSVFTHLFYECTKLVSAENLILPATTLTNSCYDAMFYGCTSLVNTPVLPATTLTNRCYEGMFQGCTSLSTAPVLPATTLADYCYDYMFNGCTSLVNAPELPSTELAEHCYYHMFEQCTSLTTAPELPATTLTNRCYEGMFNGCTSLSYIKAMFTTTPSTSYTNNWVRNVASTGTFVKNSAATWNVTGDYAIPRGWTIETASA